MSSFRSGGAYDRPDPAEVQEAQGKRSRGFNWRLWLGIAVVGVVLLSCPLLVLFLVALINDPKGTEGQMTSLVHEGLTIAQIGVPTVIVLGILYATRHVWFAWRFKPVYARDDRFPAIVDTWGRVTQIDNQAPRLEHLHSVQAGALPTGMFKEVPEVAGLLEAPEASLVPERGRWEEVRPLIGSNRIFFGWSVDGPLFGSLEAALTMACVGQQGLGKTTLARSLTLQAVLGGADVVIWDGYNDIAREMRGYFPHCYSDPRDIEINAAQLLRKMEERKQLWNDYGEQHFREIFIVADEWAMLVNRCKLAKQVIQEGMEWGRKIGFRFFLAAVRLPAKMIGEELSKGILGAYFLFAPDTTTASQFGVSGARGQAVVSAAYTAGKGFCILRSGRMGLEGSIIALPEITSAMFKQEIARLPAHVSELEEEPAPRAMAWTVPAAEPAAAAEDYALPLLPMKPGRVRLDTPAIAAIDQRLAALAVAEAPASAPVSAAPPSAVASEEPEIEELEVLAPPTDIRQYLEAQKKQQEKKQQQKPIFTQEEWELVKRMHFLDDPPVPKSRILPELRKLGISKDGNIYHDMCRMLDEVRAQMAAASEPDEDEAVVVAEDSLEGA